MQEQITIASLNCQGLGGKGKRKDVRNFLKQKKYSIYCIQELRYTFCEKGGNFYQDTMPMGL